MLFLYDMGTADCGVQLPMLSKSSMQIVPLDCRSCVQRIACEI